MVPVQKTESGGTRRRTGGRDREAVLLSSVE